MGAVSYIGKCSNTDLEGWCSSPLSCLSGGKKKAITQESLQPDRMAIL